MYYLGCSLIFQYLQINMELRSNKKESCSKETLVELRATKSLDNVNKNEASVPKKSIRRSKTKNDLPFNLPPMEPTLTRSKTKALENSALVDNCNPTNSKSITETLTGKKKNPPKTLKELIEIDRENSEFFWRMKEDDDRIGMEEGGIPEIDVNVLHNLDKRKRLRAAAAKVMRFSALITYKLS